MVKLFNLGVCQHVTSFQRNPDHRYISVVAFDEVERSMNTSTFETPMLGIFRQVWVFIYCICNLIHEVSSCIFGVPFIFVNCRICSIQNYDSVRQRGLIDGRLQRRRCPIEKELEGRRFKDSGTLVIDPTDSECPGNPYLGLRRTNTMTSENVYSRRGYTF